MIKQFFFIAFFALITYCYSQYTSSGQCSDRTNVKAVDNFDFARYGETGRRWYTVFTYNTPADCQFVNFTITSNITVDFFWRRKNLTDGTWNGRSDGVVTWTPDSGTRNGIISLRYPNVPDPLIYPILGVDYDSFVLDYRCLDINSTSKMELIWARSRTTVYSSEVAAQVQQILSDSGLSDLAPTYAVQDPERCLPYP
ncbi:uncharacterized protein LOC108744971 [Agrilus planipennis]|uniref:Uncharacterized protein LOC108744971 n=1 Tax=Agrilus planipennis TaxID=224129 RepID=A0A7F5RND8_AGRPL|nr:uncharacterized protein LOC112906803 isoform X3 [Agrilus planipennis]XP_025837538.1 uncharacterized protein LOC108744971 [Agrilus planipennis]